MPVTPLRAEQLKQRLSLDKPPRPVPELRRQCVTDTLKALARLAVHLECVPPCNPDDLPEVDRERGRIIEAVRVRLTELAASLEARSLHELIVKLRGLV